MLCSIRTIIRPNFALPRIAPRTRIASKRRGIPHTYSPLVYRNALLLKLYPRLINLFHELIVSIRYVVEGEHAVAQLEKEICAERDDGPERQLSCSQFPSCIYLMREPV